MNEYKGTTKDTTPINKEDCKPFKFAYEFQCWVKDGVVWIEEYAEGEYPLEHIKTVGQYISLHKILTNKIYSNE